MKYDLNMLISSYVTSVKCNHCFCLIIKQHPPEVRICTLHWRLGCHEETSLGVTLS